MFLTSKTRNFAEMNSLHASIEQNGRLPNIGRNTVDAATSIEVCHFVYIL